MPVPKRKKRKAVATRRPQLSQKALRYQANFEKYASKFGLVQSDLNKDFVHEGKKFKLVGCSANVNSMTPMVGLDSKGMLHKFSIFQLQELK